MSATSASSDSGGSPSPERVTVNLTTRTVRSLDRVVNLTSDTKTDSINRAIQVYAYLEEVMQNGGSVFATRGEGSTPEQIRFF
jgi:hypothetical protein